MPGTPSPPSIAFLDQYASCGGGQRILLSLIQEAAAVGWRTTAVLPAGRELGALIRQVSPETALRDEGVSYHYLPPAREVKMNPTALATEVE